MLAARLKLALDIACNAGSFLLGLQRAGNIISPKIRSAIFLRDIRL